MIQNKENSSQEAGSSRGQGEGLSQDFSSTNTNTNKNKVLGSTKNIGHIGELKRKKKTPFLR